MTQLDLDPLTCSRENGFVSSTSDECIVCGGAEEDGQTFALASCGHFFCSQCWQDDVGFKLEKGEEIFDVRCMEKCRELVDLNVLSSLCRFPRDPDGGDKLLRYAATQFANQSPHFARCINSPSCSGFVYLPKKDHPAPSVTCGFCNEEFCFICRRSRHTPATCSEVQRWEAQIDHDSASTSCVISTTKGCPKCHRRIEKNKGCLHMTCRNPCGYEFCWNCLGPWENHDNFRCVKPEDWFRSRVQRTPLRICMENVFSGKRCR